MTIEEAREYWSMQLERAADWSMQLERAAGYSDAHWDAEERHEHADYIDALKHAVTALAICREREEAAKKPKTNGDRIRQMTEEELADKLNDKCTVCVYHNAECDTEFCLCEEGVLKWLKQEASEDATERTD